MRLRDFAAVSGLIGLAVVGCGNASGSNTTLRVKEGGGAAAVAQGAGKSVVAGSPDLALVVSPTSGPPGTIVHLQATGCVDPNGLNHAVSFNAASARADGRNPHAVRAIASTMSGNLLTASYTVSNADRGAAHGVFYVQCGSTVVHEPFTVTR
jgi:hypothetical protein